MHSSLPRWLGDNPEKYASLGKSLAYVSSVFQDLGSPLLERPPDQTISGEYGDWTWIWLLNPNQEEEPAIICRMDDTGRAELWLRSGPVWPHLSVVACKWGSDHKFKYGYLKFCEIKEIWEAISRCDSITLHDIFLHLKPKYYQHHSALAKL